MLGHLADQNQFWLDNCILLEHNLLFFFENKIVLYYTACSHNAFYGADFFA